MMFSESFEIKEGKIYQAELAIGSPNLRFMNRL